MKITIKNGGHEANLKFNNDEEFKRVREHVIQIVKGTNNFPIYYADSNKDHVLTVEFVKSGYIEIDYDKEKPTNL